MIPAESPYAVFAERILMELDGSISLIRIFDSYEVDESVATAVGEDGLTRVVGGNVTGFSISMLVSFPVETHIEDARITIEGINPRGERTTIVDDKLHFRVGTHRVQFVADIDMRVTTLGGHRFVVSIDEEPRLMVPLRIDRPQPSSDQVPQIDVVED